LPLVLETLEHVEDINVPDLSRVSPGFWRTLVQSLVWRHTKRSPHTQRSCTMTRPQTMETLAERFARQYPFLYIQAGSDL
jgi:hypothetical protein